MFIKVDEKKVKELQSYTITDYEVKNELMPVECINNIIEDALHEIHNLEEKIEDLEQDIENNYELKNINPYVEYGINEKDFI